MHVLGGVNAKYDEYATWWELNFGTAGAGAGGAAGTWNLVLGNDAAVNAGRFMHVAAIVKDTMWVFGGTGQSTYYSDFKAYALRDDQSLPSEY
jgi:hypothetical protein